jgi:hypothetical protein
MRSERIVVKLTFEFILPLLETYHLIYITRFVDCCLSLCPFSISHCVVCPSSI